nr:hypothetical protein Itr_chr15CG13480 [Ipomoea trifida]
MKAGDCRRSTTAQHHRRSRSPLTAKDLLQTPDCPPEIEGRRSLPRAAGLLRSLKELLLVLRRRIAASNCIFTRETDTLTQLVLQKSVATPPAAAVAAEGFPAANFRQMVLQEIA